MGGGGKGETHMDNIRQEQSLWKYWQPFPLSPVPKRKYFPPTQTLDGNDLGDSERQVVESPTGHTHFMRQDGGGRGGWRQPAQEVEEKRYLGLLEEMEILEQPLKTWATGEKAGWSTV